jgi:hypothetical protein
MNTISDDDWRLAGQERYLVGAILRLENYVPPSEIWDHDHCDFCWEKFTFGDNTAGLKRGYTTLDHSHWICEKCFHDFQSRFKLTLDESSN